MGGKHMTHCTEREEGDPYVGFAGGCGSVTGYASVLDGFDPLAGLDLVTRHEEVLPVLREDLEAALLPLHEPQGTVLQRNDTVGVFVLYT
jgi:hypothetical protein